MMKTMLLAAAFLAVTASGASGWDGPVECEAGRLYAVERNGPYVHRIPLVDQDDQGRLSFVPCGTPESEVPLRHIPDGDTENRENPR